MQGYGTAGTISYVSYVSIRMSRGHIRSSNTNKSTNVLTAQLSVGTWILVPVEMS